MRDLESTTAIPEPIVEQAISWFLQCQGDENNAQLHAWLAQDPLHQLAWQRVSKIDSSFNNLNMQVPSSVLAQSQHNAGRRQLLKSLVALGVVGGSGAGAWYLHFAKNPYVTATAQTGRFELEFSSVELNAASEFELLAHDNHSLKLVSGDAWLKTHKPTKVQLGTQILNVAEHSELWLNSWQHTQFVLRSGALLNMPHVQTDQAYILTSNKTWQHTALRYQPSAWRKGQLVAQDMPLSDCMAYFARYHNVVIKVANDIANLPVSGVFKLKDLTGAIAILTDNHKLNVKQLAGLWYRLAK